MNTFIHVIKHESWTQSLRVGKPGDDPVSTTTADWSHWTLDTHRPRVWRLGYESERESGRRRDVGKKHEFGEPREDGPDARKECSTRRCGVSHVKHGENDEGRRRVHVARERHGRWRETTTDEYNAKTIRRTYDDRTLNELNNGWVARQRFWAPTGNGLDARALTGHGQRNDYERRDTAATVTAVDGYDSWSMDDRNLLLFLFFFWFFPLSRYRYGFEKASRALRRGRPGRENVTRSRRFNPYGPRSRRFDFTANFGRRTHPRPTWSGAGRCVIVD